MQKCIPMIKPIKIALCINYWVYYYYYITGFNSLPGSLTNTSEDYNTSIDSSTQIDGSSVLETLLEDQEIVTPKSKIHIFDYMNYLLLINNWDIFKYCNKIFEKKRNF